MESASSTGDGLKAKINQVRARVLDVASSRECDCPETGEAARTCGGRTVATRRFVVFRCSHAFRLSCIDDARGCPACGNNLF